jgi:zinc protease
MKSRFPAAIALLSAIGLSIGFPQVRQLPQKQGSSRIAAPFLQQLKSFEDTPNVTKAVLKNGMTVLINEYRAQPVVSVQAYIQAGIFNEPAQHVGIARLLAGMLYRGGPDKTLGTPQQNAHALGGLLKSSSQYRHTEFEIIAPSTQWKKALEVQANALLNPSFDPAELKLESDLLQSQARAFLDAPEAFAGEKLIELGFNQPLMGKWDTMSSAVSGGITCETLIGFHKATYTPQRMMLVISGDISAGEVLNEVVRLYNKPSAPPAKLFVMPPAERQSAFRYRDVRGSVRYPRILFGFHTGAQDSEDYASIEVLNAIIGLGEGSVLASRLRDKKGLILGGETQLLSSPGIGYLTIQIEVEPENIDRSEIALMTELELLKREDPDEMEMERALAQLETDYWSGMEIVTGRAEALARFESAGDWKQWDRTVSRLRQVKAPDVRRAAQKYLRLDNCSLLEYLPASGLERKLTVDGVRNTLEGLLGPSADQEQAAREKETVFAVKYAAYADTFKLSEIRYPFQTASVLRGPDIFIREDHTAPLIRMGLFFPGGKLIETRENAGITKLMARLMLRGTKETSAAQFNRQLEACGGLIVPVVADDYFGFYFSILSRNFDTGFNLLVEAIKAPVFDKDAIEREKKAQLSEIRAHQNSELFPSKLLFQSLFRDFSYARDSDGTEESLAGIDAKSLQSLYESNVKNKKPTVVIIGDTKGTSLAAYFVQNFSGSRMQDIKLTDASPKILDKGEKIERSWDRNYSAILIGFQTPPMDDESRYALTVLQSYAGEPGKFYQEIRDKQGSAFNVALSYMPRLRGGSMIAYAATSPGREEVALKALQEEIGKIVNEPVSYRDYRAALNSAAGAYRIASQNWYSQITRVVESALAGSGLQGYQIFPTEIQAIKQEDFQDSARQIFRMEKAVIVRMNGRR